MKKEVAAQEIIDYIEAVSNTDTAIMKICCLDDLFRGRIYRDFSMNTSEIQKLMEWVKRS